MSGTIFEYTDDDLQDFCIDLKNIIDILERNSHLGNVSRESVNLMISVVLDNNQGIAVCNGISEVDALANLIYLKSKECVLYGKYPGRGICFPNYIMKISNLIKGSKKLLMRVKNMRRCCICANVNKITNSVLLSDRSLEYEKDSNEARMNYK